MKSLASLLLLGVLHHSVICESPYSASPEWIKIGPNFPPTKENGKISQFFYIRGGYNVSLGMKDEFHHMTDVDYFYYKFDVWQSNIEGLKDFIVRPENKTILLHDEWKTIENKIQFRDVKDWYFRMFAEEKPDMVIALRNLEVKYENYASFIDDSAKNILDSHYVHPAPNVEEVKDYEEDWTFFNCDASDCDVVLPKHAQKRSVSFLLWHSVDAHSTGDLDIKTSPSRSKWSKSVTVDIDENESFMFKVIANNSDAVRLLISGAKQTVEFPKTPAFQTSEIKEFILNHPDSKIVIFNPGANEAVNFLLGKEHLTDETGCYSLDYDIQNLRINSLSISVVTHDRSVANQYQMFQTDGRNLVSLKQIKFCLGEFIFDPKVLFGKRREKIQLFLTLKVSEIQDRSNIERHALFSVDMLDDQSFERKTLPFLTDNDSPWTRVFPESIKIVDKRTVQISGNQIEERNIELNTLWITNDPHLIDAPIHIRVKIDGMSHLGDPSTFIEEIQQKMNVALCDELSDCITAHFIKRTSPENLQYILSFQFDQHPNRKSSAMKLALNVIIPKIDSAVRIQLSLDSFGDPCYGETTECKKLFGESSRCDNSLAKFPNDYKKACYCDAGTTCSDDKDNKRYVGHVCLSELGNSVQCLCKQSKDLDKLLVWSKTEDCHDYNGATFSVNGDKTESKWIYPFEKTHLQNYDICFRLKSSKKDSGIGTLKASFLDGQDSLNLFNSVKIRMVEDAEVLADFCLNDFVSHNHELWTKYSQLEIIFESNDKPTFDEKSLSVYGKNLDLEEQKLPSKASEFKALSILPTNIVYMANNGYFRFDQQRHDPFTVRIFGEWIQNHAFNSDEIDRNILKSDQDERRWRQYFEICRPRTGEKNDCIEYTGKRKLSSILTSLNTDRIQIVLVLTSDEPADQLSRRSFPVGTISLWDSCTIYDVKCMNGAKCISVDDDNVYEYQCDSCPRGFAGKLCDLKYDESCHQNNTKICDEHNSDCVAEPNKQFSCQCPKGYAWNRENKVCDRMTIQKFDRKCKPNTNSEECWLNTTLYDRFRSLPKFFPSIDSEESKHETNILFTFTPGSKISMIFENHLEGSDSDYCLNLAYFLSSSSKIALTMSDKHFLTLESNRIVDEKTSFPLSNPTSICLRSFFPFEEFTKSGTWKLDMEAQIESNDDTVAVQLFPSLFDRMLEIKSVNSDEYASSNVTFLSPTTEDHSLLDEAVRKRNSLTYQWPVQIPSHKIELRKEAPSTIVFDSAKDGFKDTLNGFILESTWISRPIRLSRNISGQVNLNFKIIVDYADPDDSSTSIKMNVLNEKRQVIYTESSEMKHKESKEQKQLFKLNRKLTVDPEYIYKIQLIFRVNGQRFKIRIQDLSFGDPCSEMLNFDKSCHSFDANGKIVKNQDAKCDRLQEPNGDVELKCQCDEHSKGKYCSVLDYCSMTHDFDLFNEENKPQKYRLTGKEFCGENADCLNWQQNIDDPKNRNIYCVCPDKTTEFDEVDRYCKPLSSCANNKCNPNTEECDPHTMRCRCKEGYKDEKNDGVCVELPVECDPKEECKDSPDRMQCFRDKESRKPVCTCKAGYQKLNSKLCVPIMCEHPSTNNCAHYCVPTEKAPFFRCECEPRYYQSENKIENGTVVNNCKLTLNAPERCSKCKIEEFKICVAGESDCVCKKDFVLDSDGKCVPQATIQWKACPNGKIKIDASRKMVCDCDNSTLPYFTDKNGVCKLEKNVCRDGEIGRKLCGARNSGCLPSPYAIDDFQCVCPVGMAFTKIKGDHIGQYSRKDLLKNPSLRCVNICELPHNKHECASLGARCNYFSIQIPKGFPKTCECIPGTFYDSLSKTCVQISNSISVNMTMKWSPNYQLSSEKSIFDLQLGLADRINVNSLMNLDVIDSLGYSQALLDSHYDNVKLFSDYQQEVNRQQTKVAVEIFIRELFVGFGIIRRTSDVHIVRFGMDPSTVPATISMQLAVKYPVNEDDITEFLAFDEDNEDLVRKDMIERFKVDLNNTIYDKCGKLKDLSSCVIAFFQHGTFLEPETVPATLNLPCNTGQSCHGMSDCIPLNGSQFECRCNSDYFDIEQSFSFESAQRETLLKNELCLPKNLCSGLCNSETEICNQTTPAFDYLTATWKIDHQCECNNDTALSDGECVGVCRIADCTKNGKCVRSGAHQAKCQCDNGFYGDRCQHELSSNTVWIIVVSVLGVVSVIAIGLAVFFYIRRRRPSSHPTPTVIPAREHQQLKRQHFNAEEYPPEQQQQQQQQSQPHSSRSETLAKTSSSVAQVLGRDYLPRNESFANRIMSAVQPSNSYSPSKTQRRELPS